jgi:hypothetical protein
VGAFSAYFDAAGTESDSDVIGACGALSYLDARARFDENSSQKNSPILVLNLSVSWRSLSRNLLYQIASVHRVYEDVVSPPRHPIKASRLPPWRDLPLSPSLARV